MVVLGLALLVVAADPDDGLAKTMLPIYVKEASEYTMAVESTPKKELELTKEPVFEWSNPVRSGVQQGVVFLWLREGGPAALGCIFSQPAQLPGRRGFHEFHALDTEKRVVSRPNAPNEWTAHGGGERNQRAQRVEAAGGVGAKGTPRRRVSRHIRRGAAGADAAVGPGFHRLRDRQRGQALGPAPAAGAALPLPGSQIRHHRRRPVHP